jgi:hypothetical protein
VKEFIGYQGAWSENGEYFAFLHGGGRKTHLILFDKRGNILWKKELEGNAPTHLYISNSGRFIVTNSFSRSKPYPTYINIFNKVGDLVKNLVIPYPNYVFPFISPDGKITIIAKKNTIVFYNIQENKIEWEKNIGDNRRIISGDISLGGKCIAIAGIENELDGLRFISIFDKTGNKTLEQKNIFTSKKVIGIWPKIKIAQNGKYVFFLNDDKLWFFENLIQE